MLTIILGVLLLAALFGVPIVFKPRRPLLKRLSGDAFEITNVGYGTLEQFPQFLMAGFLLMGIVMSIGETDLTRLPADAAILLVGLLIGLLSLFWLRNGYKSYRFNSAAAKAELVIYRFGKPGKVREYLLQKPFTALTVSDSRADGGVTYYSTQWNVIGGKAIKIEHDTDEERKYFRDWLRQNGCSVT